MAYSEKSVFEDLSAELHISIFEYLNANELVESFFDLNQYFKKLLCDRYLLLHCTLIDDQNNVDILLSNICLQQMKSLKCYDYHIIQFDNPNKLLSLHSLVVFKYATNIHEEILIDFILGIPQLKYCQIRISQSHGQMLLVPPYYQQSKEPLSSNLEGLDIESKSGLSFSYFYSDVLRRLPYLRYLKVNLFCGGGNNTHDKICKPIDELVYLTKLNLKICSAELEHLYFLSQFTQNLEYFKLDCLIRKSDQSFLDAQKWFQLLSSWKNIKVLSMYAQSKNNMPYINLHATTQLFKSIPFLVERHVYPFYPRPYSSQRIYINAHYRKS